MAYALTWLPDVLLAAGLKIARQDGWETRGEDRLGVPAGVMIHHTAGGRTGNMPSLGTITHGRAATARQKALPGPLCHLGLGRDGTFYIVAARLANHAGPGEWGGVKTGNSSFIGIECENCGTPDDPWPDVQMDALRRGVAALLRKINADRTMCCGHKEYAPHRKIDPLFDMNRFRAEVAGIMAGTGTVRPPIAAVAPMGQVTLRRGASGADVARLQQKLQVKVDSDFGPATEVAVRTFQRDHGLVPDGIVGPATWDVIDGR
jgi:hypothetical protein